jgi:predicted alpha/beta-fold hydrolase
MPFQPTRPFVPALGLSSPHAQTIFASLLRKPRVPGLLRERWRTPDGDFVDVDRLYGSPGAPRLLVLHGLEGSSRSGYVLQLLSGAAARGWGAVALNFRSCSGEPNLLARSYSSGDWSDPLFVLDRLRAEEGEGPLFAVGHSLGGNVLLKLLGEAAERAKLKAAVAVSVPFDLQACVRAVDGGRGFFALYLRNFLYSMKSKALDKARRFPDRLDARAIRAVRTIEGIDETVTAPLYGFASAADYYARCSSGPWVAKITTATLLISAADDPLAPARLLPESSRTNPHVQLLVTARGGHVGFVDGSMASPRYWAEEQALAFLDGFTGGWPSSCTHQTSL